MKKLILAAIAAAMALSVTSALAQGEMHMKPHMKPPMHQGGAMMHDGNKMMETMMQGLTTEEKQTATSHFMHMTQAEKDVMHKRMTMCMKDPHKGMMAMMKGKSPKEVEAMGMKHMMSGLSKGEQQTMMQMWSKMDAKQKAVAHKMMMNCCMYGMKHAK